MPRLTRVAMFLGLALGAMALSESRQPPITPVAVGDVFPRLEGEFLSGKKAILPDAAKGHVALVLMGFTYDSRFAVEQWAEHVRPAFAKTGTSTFYEVPVLGGMARMAKWFIDSGMRRGTPKELHENVITVWGGVGRWKTLMNFSNAAKDDAYVALLDAEGRVRWLHHGPYAADRFDAMLQVAARH